MQKISIMQYIYFSQALLEDLHRLSRIFTRKMFSLFFLACQIIQLILLRILAMKEAPYLCYNDRKVELGFHILVGS
jgi:hypothetical protein